MSDTDLGRVVPVALREREVAQVLLQQPLPGLGVVVRVRPHEPRGAADQRRVAEHLLRERQVHFVGRVQVAHAAS